MWVLKWYKKLTPEGAFENTNQQIVSFTRHFFSFVCNYSSLTEIWNKTFTVKFDRYERSQKFDRYEICAFFVLEDLVSLSKGIHSQALIRTHLLPCCPWMSLSGWWLAASPPETWRSRRAASRHRDQRKSPGRGCCLSASWWAPAG